MLFMYSSYDNKVDFDFENTVDTGDREFLPVFHFVAGGVMVSMVTSHLSQTSAEMVTFPRVCSQCGLNKERMPRSNSLSQGWKPS